MIDLRSLLDELEKIALTRSVKEWRAAQQAGQGEFANQIAQGAGQLGLKPRYLENVSGGGMEAGVDKMMGRAMGPEANASGLLARKIYKPDSPVTTGADTTHLLQQKQTMTDAARGLSHEAKAMVPAMYGHKEIQGPGGQLRHVSEHELVQGATRLSQDPNAIQHTEALHKNVVAPLEAKGMPMRDVARVHEGRLAGNVGNVAMTPQGPKVVDFLPETSGSALKVIQHGGTDAVGTTTGRVDTSYGKHNMNELRREVYRPTANYQPPANAPAPTPSAAASSGRTAVTAAAVPKPAGTTAVTNVAVPRPKPSGLTVPTAMARPGVVHTGPEAFAKTMMSPTLRPPSMGAAAGAAESALGKLSPARAAGMMGKLKPVGSTMMHALRI